MIQFNVEEIQQRIRGSKRSREDQRNHNCIEENHTKEEVISQLTPTIDETQVNDDEGGYITLSEFKRQAFTLLWTPVCLRFDSVTQYIRNRNSGQKKKPEDKKIVSIDTIATCEVAVIDDYATSDDYASKVNKYGLGKVARSTGATLRSGIDIDDSDIVKTLAFGEEILFDKVVKVPAIPGETVSIERVRAIELGLTCVRALGWASLTGRTIEDQDPILSVVRWPSNSETETSDRRSMARELVEKDTRVDNGCFENDASYSSQTVQHSSSNSNCDVKGKFDPGRKTIDHSPDAMQNSLSLSRSKSTSQTPSTYHSVGSSNQYLTTSESEAVSHKSGPSSDNLRSYRSLYAKPILPTNAPAWQGTSATQNPDPLPAAVKKGMHQAFSREAETSTGQGTHRQAKTPSRTYNHSQANDIVMPDTISAQNTILTAPTKLPPAIPPSKSNKLPASGNSALRGSSSTAATRKSQPIIDSFAIVTSRGPSNLSASTSRTVSRTPSERALQLAQQPQVSGQTSSIAFGQQFNSSAKYACPVCDEDMTLWDLPARNYHINMCTQSLDEIEALLSKK